MAQMTLFKPSRDIRGVGNGEEGSQGHLQRAVNSRHSVWQSGTIRNRGRCCEEMLAFSSN